jgi:hypothetical protein
LQSGENKGFYISYGKDDKDLKGVLEIEKINNVTESDKTDFAIEYDGQRTFQLRAKSKNERDTWVHCINFLRDVKEKMGSQLDRLKSQSISAYFNDSFASESRESSGSFAGKETWKLKNIDKEALLGVTDEESKDTKNESDLSEKALEVKGILSYIEEIPLIKRK